MMHFVEEILDARPYTLTLRFSTGETRSVPLEATLRANATSVDSAYRRLLDPAVFLRARLDRNAGTVSWDGLAIEVTAEGEVQPAPLDFCPDVLYELSAPVGGSGPKPADSSTLALREEPPGPQ
jgi:hypothetical protein